MKYYTSVLFYSYVCLSPLFLQSQQVANPDSFSSETSESTPGEKKKSNKNKVLNTIRKQNDRIGDIDNIVEDLRDDLANAPQQTGGDHAYFNAKVEKVNNLNYQLRQKINAISESGPAQPGQLSDLEETTEQVEGLLYDLEDAVNQGADSATKQKINTDIQSVDDLLQD